MVLAPAGIGCVTLGTFMALGYDGHRMQQTGAEPTCSCNLRMDQVVLAMRVGMGRPEAVSPPPSSSTCLLVLEKHPSQSCGDSVIQGDWGALSKHRSCRQLGCREPHTACHSGAAVVRAHNRTLCQHSGTAVTSASQVFQQSLPQSQAWLGPERW